MCHACNEWGVSNKHCLLPFFIILDLYEMSLFKAREWWSTTVGEEEDFDQGCLCVANIDNSENELGTYAVKPTMWTSLKENFCICSP